MSKQILFIPGIIPNLKELERPTAIFKDFGYKNVSLALPNYNVPSYFMGKDERNDYICDQIVSTVIGEPLTIISHSIGGNYALWLSAYCKKLGVEVDKLVLLQPAFKGYPILINPMYLSGDPNKNQIEKEAGDNFVSSFMKSPAQHLRTIYSSRKLAKTALPNVTLPTMIVASKKDLLVPKESIISIEQQLLLNKVPMLYTLWLEKGEHAIFNSDKYLLPVIEEIDSFIKGDIGSEDKSIQYYKKFI